MDFQEILIKRQSIRRYEEAGIPKKDIEQIIKAAGVAPSSKNIQNWHFVAIQNKNLIQKIGDAILRKNEEIALRMDGKDPEKAKRFRKFPRSFTLFFLNAPVLIVVFTTFQTPAGYEELELIDGSIDEKVALVLKSPSMQSLGASLENLSLKATELGYGTCWLSSANYAANEIASVLKSEIGFEKPGFSVAALIPLGVPKANQPHVQKKHLEEILTYVE